MRKWILPAAVVAALSTVAIDAAPAKAQEVRVWNAPGYPIVSAYSPGIGYGTYMGYPVYSYTYAPIYPVRFIYPMYSYPYGYYSASYPVYGYYPASYVPVYPTTPVYSSYGGGGFGWR